MVDTVEYRVEKVALLGRRETYEINYQAERSYELSCPKRAALFANSQE